MHTLLGFLSFCATRVLFLFGLALLGQSLCRAQDVPYRVGPAEQYVLRGLKNGEEVDLDRPFPGKTDQRLNPVFLEKLLAGSFKDSTIERRGIRIHHAVFDLPVFVSHVTVPYEVWLNDCTFREEVDFEGTHFEKDFSLEHSRFETPPGEPAESLSLTNLVVKGDLVLRRASFQDSADVTGSSIGGRLIGDEAQSRARAGETANARLIASGGGTGLAHRADTNTEPECIFHARKGFRGAPRPCDSR